MKPLTPLDASRLALCGSVFMATAALSLFMPGFSRSVRAAWEDSPKVVLDQAWQIVYREYVDPSFNRIDWLAVRQNLLDKDYSSTEAAYTALREALGELEDPYTRFMDPEQYQGLTNQTSGELSGVGIRLKADETTGELIVLEPLQNSPAVAAGIQSGDRVLSIDGTPTKGMDVGDAADLIRGEVGTQVTLTLQREQDGQATTFDVTLTRARIEVPSIHYSLNQEGPYQVGYIRLNQFTSHAAREMRDAIRDLSGKGADAFVLDLRGNPGGLLHASIDIARMWLEDGLIVKTVDRNSQDEEIRANHTALTQLPLAVLVDGSSASSSEILAGALQDNQRATLVGTQTFGKALVQSLHPLSDGSGIAVTIAHYYTPKGTDISKKGIAPDIAVELSQQERQQLSQKPENIATPADPQYKSAITFLETTFLAQPGNSPQVSGLETTPSN
jgi:carboxyl-terminal processing protease